MAFLRVIRALAPYGSRAVNWAWANKGRILSWLGSGYTVAEIVYLVLRYM